MIVRLKVYFFSSISQKTLEIFMKKVCGVFKKLKKNVKSCIFVAAQFVLSDFGVKFGTFR